MAAWRPCTCVPGRVCAEQSPLSQTNMVTPALLLMNLLVTRGTLQTNRPVPMKRAVYVECHPRLCDRRHYRPLDGRHLCPHGQWVGLNLRSHTCHQCGPGHPGDPGTIPELDRKSV